MRKLNAARLQAQILSAFRERIELTDDELAQRAEFGTGRHRAQSAGQPDQPAGSRD
jgi:hypothetical protein